MANQKRLTTEIHSENQNNYITRVIVYTARFFTMAIFLLMLVYHEEIQGFVNLLYKWLLDQPLFHSVYFETGWIAASYLLVQTPAIFIDYIPFFERYKLHPQAHFVWPTTQFVYETIEFATPLLILDTFIVKKYPMVDPMEWNRREQDWIKYTRPLPVEPPSLLEISYSMVLSFVIFDFLFFIDHYVVHKYAWLYKNVHKRHHTHGVLHTMQTDKMTIVERMALMFLANLSLQLTSSHPLTRAVFIFVFTYWKIELHMGYDLPFTLDKIIPGNLVGGASHHYAHHMHGRRHYQFFFTYIDNYLIKLERKRKQSDNSER